MESNFLRAKDNQLQRTEVTKTTRATIFVPPQDRTVPVFVFWAMRAQATSVRMCVNCEGKGEWTGHSVGRHNRCSLSKVGPDCLLIRRKARQCSSGHDSLEVT